MIALSAGPTSSNALIRSRYAWTSGTHRIWPAAKASWIPRIVASGACRHSGSGDMILACTLEVFSCHTETCSGPWPPSSPSVPAWSSRRSGARRLRRVLLRRIPGSNSYKKDLSAEIDGMKDFTQQMVDQVFSFGELGFQEVETSKYLTGILEEERVQRRGARRRNPDGVDGDAGGRASRSSRSAPTSTAFRRRRRSRASRITIRSSRARPGTAKGHNSGMPLNITAALALKKIMERDRIAGHDSAVAGHRRGAARHQGVLRARRRLQGRRRRPLRARRQPTSA